MRFYAACLASYNNGILHGAWIDASTDLDAMQAEINAMLKASRFPNVQRQDYVDEDGKLLSIDAMTRPEHVPEDWTPKGEPYPSAEEWAIHDSEGLGDIGEYAGLAEIARRASAAELAEDRDIPLSVLLQLASDYLSGDWDSSDLESEIDDRYRGAYDTWRDFAEELTEETQDMNAIPEWLQGHIDWDSIARDFELSGDFAAYTESSDSRPLYLFWAA